MKSVEHSIICRPRPSSNDPFADRKGFLLVVVLVVVMMAALVCYQFADRMVTERQVVSSYRLEAQAVQAALSGVDYMLALTSAPDFSPADLATKAPEDYAWQVMQSVEIPGKGVEQLYFVLVSREQTLRNGELAFGVSGEAGKINLNGLVKLDVPEEQQREVLMVLPGMTETLADTILDFIDSDTVAREYGTESDEGDYVVRNGPISSLDDLLIVPGITPSLLYGEDLNRNGFLEKNEDDGDLREPFDNADGILDAGWSAWLTLAGRESNLQSDGTAKINVNADDLDQLEKDLTDALGGDYAQFVIGYRANGPSAAPTDSGSSGTNSAGNSGSGGGQSGQSQAGQGQSGSGGSGSGGSSRGAGTGGAGTSSTSQGGSSSGGGQSSWAQFRVTSLYELIDSVTGSYVPPVEGQEADEPIILSSPWVSTDLAAIKLMEDVLTLDDSETRSGRIDMNFATSESLSGLPEISEAVITEIVNGAGTWTSPAELLQKGVIDIVSLRKLEPYLTTRSKTYRFTSIGLWQSGGPIVRMEAVIDTAGPIPVILSLENLSPLGAGYTREELLPEGVSPQN